VIESVSGSVLNANYSSTVSANSTNGTVSVGQKTSGQSTDSTSESATTGKESSQAGSAAAGKAKTAGTTTQQSTDVQQQISQMVQTQNHVISHEQAHMSAGGELAGSPSYTYTSGPDGKRYITGGEVSISTPSVKEPEDKIRMMERVRSAAMAPSDPSPQDIRVAADASMKESQAQSELSRKRLEQAYGKTTQGSEKVASKTSEGTGGKTAETVDKTKNGTAVGNNLDIAI